MLKRKIEPSFSVGKRQKLCSGTAQRPDACKGTYSSSEWVNSFAAAPNSTLHQQVLRDPNDDFNNIDACAAIKHLDSSNAACAAVGTAGTVKAVDHYQLATGNAVGMNGAYLTNITWDGNKWSSAVRAAACQSTQESQSTFSSGLAAQKQSAAASTNLRLTRAPCQDPNITSLNDHQFLLGSCILQPPLTSKTSSTHPISTNQVENSSNGSCVQARGLYKPGVPKTRDLKESAVPVSKSAGSTATAAFNAGVYNAAPAASIAPSAGVHNAAPAAAVAPQLHAFQLYGSTCFWQAAAAAASSQPTTGVAAQSYPAAVEINTVDKYSNHLVNAAPGTAAPVVLKPSDSSPAATTVWGDSVLGGAPVLRPVITTGMVSAGTAVLPPVPLWSHPAQQTALPNITTHDYQQQQQYHSTTYDYHHQQQQQQQYGPIADYQQQQQYYGPIADYQQQQHYHGLTADTQRQQQRYSTGGGSAAGTDSKRTRQCPKQGTRSNPHQKASSAAAAAAAAAGAAGMINSGVKKRGKGNKRSAASSSNKQHSRELQQAKAGAAADAWALGAAAAAAAVCSDAAATAAACCAAGINYAAPTAAAAAANPLHVNQPSAIYGSAAHAISAEAKTYQTAYSDFQTDGGMFDLEGYDFAVAGELPSFELDENAHIDEVTAAAAAEAAAAAAAEAEATDENRIDAVLVAPTVAATYHLAWDNYCYTYNLVDGQPSMLADLDQGGGNSIYDGLGDVGTAAYAAAASAAFKRSLEESFDPAPYM